MNIINLIQTQFYTKFFRNIYFSKFEKTKIKVGKPWPKSNQGNVFELQASCWSPLGAPDRSRAGYRALRCAIQTGEMPNHWSGCGSVALGRRLLDAAGDGHVPRKDEGNRRDQPEPGRR